MTVERIDARFAELQRQDRAGFVAYVMAGDPDADTALEILCGLPGAGADLIELGFPFSDPMAEGPTIQLASQRALKGRMTLRGTLSLAAAFRASTRSEASDVAVELERVLAAVDQRHEPPVFARLGPVDPWLAEQARENLDISDFQHTLDVQSVRHTLRRHGLADLELSKGQLPITLDDFRLLPRLIREFDYAVFGLRTRQGQPALALIWEQDDSSTLSVQVVLNGRKRLEARSLWKWPGGARAGRLATILSHNVRNEPQVNIKIVARELRVKTATSGDADTPLILMGYLNPLLSYGYAAFARDAAEAGVDGLIVVDCPPEEADPLADALDAEGVALIRLATPTSDDARLQVVTRRTSGFVYYVSVAGVTGAKEADAAAVAPAVARVRAASGLPVAVGFGIRTPERAAEVARVADAAVVGSALVDEIAAALEAKLPAAPRVLATAKALADAVHGARVRERIA